MRRRRWVRVGLTLALLAAVGSAVGYWWTRPHIVDTGGAIVLIEGHDLALWGGEAGMGIVGTLGLVGGRCVGLVNASPSEQEIIVWPAGADTRGQGDDLRITSEGVTVRLGDRIDGGTHYVSELPWFTDRLPEECRGFRLVGVGLDS